MSLAIQPKTVSAPAQMGCMELWGGSGPRNSYFERPGLEIWVSSLSSDQYRAGGGDLHLISSCASGRITRMLQADICGQGEEFAEVADEFRALLKRHINQVHQKNCAAQMSESLRRAAERDRYASALLATYFSPRRSLVLCNAGQAPPLLFRKSAGKWIVMNASEGTPASDSSEGLLEQQEYHDFATRMNVGDMALLYSNSLTECSDECGDLLGVSGIRRMADELRQRDSTNLATALLKRIANSNPSLLDHSDATVMLCRATIKRVTFRDNLLAVLRLFRGAVDRTALS